MGTKANAARGFRYIHVPKDGMGYEFVCLTPTVHRDQEGIVSPETVTVIPFRWEGDERKQLPVNNETGAQHYVIRRYGTATPTPANVVLGSTVINQNGARFDLVAKSDVTVATSNGVTTYTYADNKILAVQYITAVKDGTDGDSAAFTSIVFKRSETKPTPNPTGGTYGNPIPTSPSGWTDAPDSGTQPLWISRARFLPTMTGATNAPTPTWSEPQQATDSTGIEYIWSAEEKPRTLPTNTHPYPDVPGATWTKSSANAVWMGVAVKNNGVWGSWEIAKIKGEDGKGVKGDNAVDYRLTVSPDQLQYDLNSTQYVTNTISVGVKKVDGNNITQVAWSALAGLGLSAVYRFLKTDGSYSLWASVPNGMISCGTTLYTRVEISLRKNNVEIDNATVAINQSGRNGTDGRNGVYVPSPMLWDDYPDGYQFKCGNVEAGETHMDMVLCKNTNPDEKTDYFIYKCRVSHTKSANHYPMADNYDGGAKPGAYWERSSGSYKFVATDVLWANVGRIEFFNAQNIRIGTSVDNMIAYFGTPVGTTHGGAIFYSGGDNVTEATFVVYADGSFTATNADIEGHISVSILDLKVSTAGEGAIPNGSLCFDTNSIKLPALSNGVVRSIKVYNPMRTRTAPNNLSLVPENTTVKISTDGNFDTVTNGTKTFVEYGRNGNVYLELLGINLNGTTIWTVKTLSSN